VLLASLAFGTIPDQKNIAVEGIKDITTEDIRFAREFGFRIKLLGIARQTAHGIDQRVRPAMVRAGTPLADVDGVFNAVMANAGPAGRYFFEGRGAGEAPTAMSVISDILDVARGSLGPSFGRPAQALKPLEPIRAPPPRPITCASRCWTCPASWPISRQNWRNPAFPSRA
jgi:homoserine dehydrogenase